MNGRVRLKDVTFKYFWVIAIVLGNTFGYHHRLTCPTETTPVRNSTDQALWQSKGEDNEIVVSVPPCVDHRDNLITRICSNGSWVPKESPSCHHLFLDNSCTSEDSSEKNCNFIPDCNDDSIYSGYGLRWMPYERRTNYGLYEFVGKNKYYGLPISDNLSNQIIYWKNDVFKKNCLLENNVLHVIIPNFCDNENYDDCRQNLQEQLNCPDNCVNNGYDKCYCKTWRNNCENLAQIDTFQDKETINDLLGDDECYIANGQTISRNLWSYSEKRLHCWVCERTITRSSNKVYMFLNFDENTRELHLMVYSPQNLLHNGNENYIYCFTDASSKLRKKVKVKKLFEHFSNQYDDTVFFVYELSLEKYIGNYWCEAFKKGYYGKKVTSNKILAYRKKKGNEYSLRMEIHKVCQLFDCPSLVSIRFEHFVPEQLKKLLDHIHLEVYIRVMEVFYFDYEMLDVLFHITTLNRRNLQKEFDAIEGELLNLQDEIIVVYFRSSEYCMKEVTQSDGNYLTWPLTAIGQVVSSNEICLQDNGFPVFRMCRGEFLYGSQWSSVHGQCQSVDPSDATKFIHYVATGTNNISEVALANVTNVIEDEDLSVLDIYYVTKILKKVFHAFEGNILINTFDLIDKLLQVKSQTLQEAQELLNSTDEILDTMQDLLRKPAPTPQKDLFLMQKQHFVIHITYPFINNITGVLIYKNNDTLTVKDFTRDTDWNNIANKDNLEFAVHVPDSQLIEWEGLNYTDLNLKDLVIITTIFFNDKFFNNEGKVVSGPVVDVVVPGFGNYLQTPIPIWYKSSIEDSDPVCAYWDYGKKTQRHKGFWNSLGSSYRSENDTVAVCEFTHLTHFALLVTRNKIDDQDEYFLDLIIIIGDTFTVCGVSGIFLTACLFESWRRKQGTKILLNLCVAILFEVILMLLLQSDLIASDKSCEIWGPMLHYVVLSKYCWMLVYAFLQHMRFVKVLGPIPSNIVLKSSIIGWGFPLVPVLSVCFYESYHYNLKNYLLCYPKGLPLYLALLAPIILIILINTVVFTIVMRHVTNKTTDVYSKNMDITSNKLQIQLATLLFFVLGLPMIFGLLCNLIPISWFQTVLIYLFCITSNIQGMVLFIFYVILNKETRSKWIRYCGGTRKLISSSTSSSRKT